MGTNRECLVLAAFERGVERNGEHALVASLGGAPQVPGWSYYVKQNPHLEVQNGAVKGDSMARRVTDDEKAGR